MAQERTDRGFLAAVDLVGHIEKDTAPSGAALSP
jgi:hypothetical protein